MKHVESLYFGGNDHLFGMYHPATGQGRNHGVVLCSPLFHEYYRSHFVLRRLAAELAQKGFDVLRFDYSGTGDSKGTIPTDMFNVWSNDIGTAMAEIRELSGCRNVTLLTSRFSASLGMPWRSSASKYVCWDAISDQTEYMAQLDATNAASLAEHVQMSESEKKHHTENDFIGSRWSRKSIGDMLSAFVSKTDAHSQDMNSNGLVNIQSNVDWVSASLKMIYAHETVQEISNAI